MDKEKSYMNFRIRKRPWYVWPIRIVWVVWLLVWAEVAIGSWQEMENRAFIISLVIFLASFVIGFLNWFRKSRTVKR